MSALSDAADAALALEAAALSRSPTPQIAAASLALALGRVCADEGIALEDVHAIVTASHDALIGERFDG